MKAILVSYQRPIVKYLGTARAFLDAPPMDWRIEKLKGFIDSNIENATWNFNEVCQQLQLGISVYQASRVFGRSMGIGLRKYATRQRLENAAGKLRNTSRSIKEIAAELGYQWPEDFARGFKKEFRLSPTEYRQLCHSVKAAQRPKHSRSLDHGEECLVPATKRILRHGRNGKR
jgi:AraC-like DNA-binding protein